jgi:peptide-methionine (R)-S-oxide reductase
MMKKTDDEWKKELTSEQYRVMREGDTERPFAGEYVHEKAKGMYACAACGAQLFSSDAKFDSGTGWPSFTDPVARENIDLVPDASGGMVRTEVKCKNCGAHLGHVFDDGPGPEGKRYCINSVCLNLKKEEK